MRLIYTIGISKKKGFNPAKGPKEAVESIAMKKKREKEGTGIPPVTDGPATIKRIIKDRIEFSKKLRIVIPHIIS